MPFVVINFAVSDLFGVGSSVVISLLLGRGERRQANNAFTCSVLLIVGLGIALGAALFATAPTIMSLMGATGEQRRGLPQRAGEKDHEQRGARKRESRTQKRREPHGNQRHGAKREASQQHGPQPHRCRGVVKPTR